MNKQNDNEIVITFPKLWDNIKRYWWIFAVCVFAAAVIIIIPFLTAEDEKRTLVTGETVIYVQTLQEDINEENLPIYIAGARRGLSDEEVSSLTESVKSLMETRNSVKEVEEKVSESSKEPGDIKELNVELETSGKMIFFTLEGGNEESVISFLNAYTDVFVEKMNALLQEDEAVIIQQAEKGSLVVEEVLNGGSTVLSVKNVFLAMLSLLTACIVVFFLTMKDTYIRDKKEVLELEDVPVLGRVWKKRPVNLGSNFILPHFLEKNQVGTAVLAAIDEKHTSMDLLQEICRCCNKELNKEVMIYAANIKEDSESLKKVSNMNNVVLLLSINGDKIKDVKEAVQNLLLLDKKITGVIYIYS